MKKTDAIDKNQTKGMTIRTKMLLLFSLLPILMLAGLGLFNFLQMNGLATLLNTQGESIVRSLAEDSIRQKSRSVANELSRYIVDHPEIAKEEFQNHPVLRKIAEQPIGETGYSVVLEAPFRPGDANFKFWTHPNDKLISLEFEKLKKPLGENYQGTADILQRVLNSGKDEAEGYYKWLDKDGQLRDKYMVITRVPGTAFIIAGTTYISEFTQPMEELSVASKSIVDKTRLTMLVGITLAIIILAYIVTRFGNQISRKIRRLSEVAERISKGDLNIKIDGKTETDELGALARSVERMRVSVKIMYKRLSATT